MPENNQFKLNVWFASALLKHIQQRHLQNVLSQQPCILKAIISWLKLCLSFFLIPWSRQKCLKNFTVCIILAKIFLFCPSLKIIISGFSNHENKSKEAEQFLSLVSHFKHLWEIHDKQLNRSSSGMEKTNTPRGRPGIHSKATNLNLVQPTLNLRAGPFSVCSPLGMQYPARIQFRHKFPPGQLFSHSFFWHLTAWIEPSHIPLSQIKVLHSKTAKCIHSSSIKELFE